jgi:HAE1 family hydrophobic/amphiphilic exporter-1
MAKMRDMPGLVDLDSSVKPDKHGGRGSAARCGVRPGPVCGQMASRCAPWWRADRGQLARPDDQTYDVNVRLAPEARNHPRTWSACPFTTGGNADGSARVVRLNQVATCANPPAPTRSTGAT